MIIGLDFYGDEETFFRSYSSPVRDIYYTELRNGIYDEFHVKERGDVAQDNIKEPWQMDTRLLAKFIDSLEAGNVDNAGVAITKFAIKRRKVDEIKDINLGYLDFVNDSTVEFTDYTQPNDKLVYSIVPIGENALEGKPSSVIVESDFVGYWIVDKDTGETFAFDKMLGNSVEVQANLNEDRIQIDTLGKYPQFYYLPQKYHSFTLSGIFVPNEGQRSNKEYERFLNTMQKHIPLIVKASNGDIFIADVSNIRKSNPLNTWKNYDYINVQVDCTEIADYNEYMVGE